MLFWPNQTSFSVLDASTCKSGKFNSIELASEKMIPEISYASDILC